MVIWLIGSINRNSSPYCMWEQLPTCETVMLLVAVLLGVSGPENRREMLKNIQVDNTRKQMNVCHVTGR